MHIAFWQRAWDIIMNWWSQSRVRVGMYGGIAIASLSWLGSYALWWALMGSDVLHDLAGAQTCAFGHLGDGNLHLNITCASLKT